MDEFIILLPALNPPLEAFKTYINELKAEGFMRIMLVDDGSRDDYKEFFKAMEEDGLIVIRHYKNFGKGRALKNAFNYLLNYYDDFSYVICADSDGQHKAGDVKNIAKKAKDLDEPYLILGSRDFDQENVPFKSRYGNKLTSFFYKALFHDEISDTQTGLRAIARPYLKDFLDLEGERFSYEINMLIEASKSDKNILEVPIETVYIGENEESHFDAVKDSIEIYATMFKTFIKFIISGLVSYLVDIGAFEIILNILKGLALKAGPAIWIASVASYIRYL